MKKIFISMPMQGREKEDIEASFSKVERVAEAILGEEVEVINPYKVKKAKEKPLESLGKSLAKMAKADYTICLDDTWEYRGCEVERMAASSYGIQTIILNLEFICPDIISKRREECTPVSLPTLSE